MRHLLLIIALSLFLPIYAKSQSDFAAPNYENIKKAAEDTQGDKYYPKLMLRYQNNDTTISESEMQVLYYGVFFHDKKYLQLFGGDTYRDSIKAIYKHDSITYNDKINLIKYYLLTHAEIPFNLKTINALYNLYTDLQDPKAVYYDQKMNKIAYTIYTTGDGKSTKTGFHVNAISDEYTMLSLLGYKFGASQSLIERCDYLKVAENKNGVKGIYFDVSKILEAEAALFSDKK
jgi:hypothetical protein